MIHLDSINSKQNSLDLGLNKSDLYAPHINALKIMNRQSTTSTLSKTNQINNIDNLFQDDQESVEPDFATNDHDLYDFSNRRPALNFETNLSDEEHDEDDDDDINFDYGYGYDYERVIKERLKKVNQEFVKEPEVAKQRPVLVSFHNAVTAFDIPNDDSNKVEFNNIPDVNVDNSNTEESVVKLPLNDTIVKKDPDSFANKIKEAVQRYDAEHSINQINNDLDREDDSYQHYLKLNNKNDKTQNQKTSTPSPSPPPTNIDSPKQKSLIKSPSPIASSPKSPDSLPDYVPEEKDNNNNNTNNKISKFNFSIPESQIRSSSNLNSLNNSDDNSININNNNNKENKENEFIKSNNFGNKNDDKMLIEKDGIFELMSLEEYLAKEKEKEKLEKEKESKKIPHPPTRPKTSNDQSRNNSLKSKFLLNKNSNQTNQQDKNLKRVSLSADSKKQNQRQKSHSPITKHSTPEYAKDYKSPYHVTIKTYKSTESEEAKKKQVEEEEERKKNNERAFQLWLKSKEKQRLLEQKRKLDNENKKSETSLTGSEDIKNSYEAWLKKKQEQINKEKEYQRKLEEFIVLDRQKSTAEERSKAFKDWISRKVKEKNEQIKLEKIENKKWISRRRKSRKHQRLSQALEMANAYGYNSSYYLPGFSF